MPRKPLPNENADVGRNSNSKVVRDVLNKDRLGKKKIPIGNSRKGTATGDRVFAREIKNLARGSRQLGNAGALDPFQNFFLGKSEPDRLNQLTTDFGSLNLRDEGGTSTVDTKIFEPVDIFSRASSFRPRSTRAVYNIDHRRRGSTPGNNSENSCQNSSGSNQCYYRRQRYSSNVFNITKRSSFRSTSIASQSTPLPRPNAPRTIRPFRPLDNDSEYHFQFSANDSTSVERSHEAGELKTQFVCGTVSKADNQAPENQDRESADADVTTQLASQLSEVVLSPCITPVEDDILQFPEVSDKSDSRTRACRTRNNGRATSFSLGFIAEAFPEEVNIKDLRIFY